MTVEDMLAVIKTNLKIDDDSKDLAIQDVIQEVLFQ